jgi:hypothetical protein
MPLPSRRKDESRKKFMSRCMGDDMMNTEFNDPKQRAAVCNSQYRRRVSSKGNASWDDVRKEDMPGLM